MRRLFIALAFLMGGFTACGTAAATGKSCAGERIGDTKIEDVQANLQRYLGKCVRLRGILADGRLYTDRQATLETNDRTDDDRRPKRSIVVLRGGKDRPLLVEITGRVADCGLANDAMARYQADHPEEIVMVSGFCHTSMETYFDKPIVRVLSKQPIPRLVAAEVPPSKWLLIEAPASLPNRDEAVNTARRFLVAIATRDETVFRKLHNPIAQDILDTEGSGVKGGMREWLTEAHADFVTSVAFRTAAMTILARPKPQIRSFVEPSDVADVQKGGTGAWRVTTCWCTREDCSGRWPIAPSQADNAPGRPYLCILTSEYALYPKGPVPYAELPQNTTGFAEP
ncbi:MAG TPA: hypothetical protein VF409_05110 [Sphingomonas sp.]